MPNAYDITWGLLLGIGAPVWLIAPKLRGKVLKALRERMGPLSGVTRDLSRPAVMIHAVSLGEINATRAMVAQLGRIRPDLQFIITTTTDTGFARGRELYGKSVHPHGAESDPLNNVFFVSEMPPGQVALEDMVREKIDGDEVLQAAVAGYREKARTFPFGIPNFGLRFPSVEAVEAVVERLRNGISSALKERVTVHPTQVFEATDGIPRVTQVFVYNDVVVTGSSALGQLIELQVQG